MNNNFIVPDTVLQYPGATTADSFTEQAFPDRNNLFTKELSTIAACSVISLIKPL